MFFYVQPAEGGRVRDPANSAVIPPEGKIVQAVKFSTYWRALASRGEISLRELEREPATLDELPEPLRQARLAKLEGFEEDEALDTEADEPADGQE